MLLLLVVLPLMWALTSAQTLSFNCTDQAMTDVCNALNANAISCQSDAECLACLYDDQCTIVPTSPPPGTECANSDCIRGFCGGYSLYLNSSIYGYSCNDIYSEEYCNYCGACLWQLDYGSGFRSVDEESCNTNYAYLLCRLLPYHFGQCLITYGYHVCLQCAGVYGELSIQQVCPALSVNDITSEETDFICAATYVCSNLAPDCDDEFNCTYCDYIQDNGLCSVTTMPPINCNLQIALACRLLESQLQQADTTCQYHNSTCEDCTKYSQCDPLAINEITLEERGILCNNDLAIDCKELVMDSDCYATNLPTTCDFCSITDPICVYNDPELLPCNASLSIQMECYINITFLPCRLLYDSDYCSNCERSLLNCNIGQLNTSFPQELCSDDEFVGTCNLISAISPSVCNDTISPRGCQFCQFVSDMFCQDSSPYNLESGADFICSDKVLSICNTIVSDDGMCYSDASDNECNVCRARLYFCPEDDGISGSYSGDGCESFDGVYCRVIAANLTDCLGKYNVAACTQCRPAVLFCGPLLVSDLSNDQVDTLCQQNENCQPLLMGSNLCNFDEYRVSCDICNEILQPLCPITNDTDTFCTSYIAEQCLTSYSYYPCYTLLPYASCKYCEAVVDICPQIGFNSSFVPDAVCADSVHMAVCDGITNDPSCSTIYGEDACEYCSNVIGKCGSIPLNVSINETLQLACRSLPQCQDIIANINESTCMNTYTPCDCTFCKFLNYSDCNSSESGKGPSSGFDIGSGDVGSGGGSGQSSECVNETNFYCRSIIEDPQCNETYDADCETCRGYVILCSDYEIDNFSYCSSIYNFILCSTLPAGPACDDSSNLCAYCNFYTGNCASEICSNKELIQPCTGILANGSSPNFTESSEECFLCSLIFHICPYVYESVTVSQSFSENLVSSTDYAFTSSNSIFEPYSSVSESSYSFMTQGFESTFASSTLDLAITSYSLKPSLTIASLQSSIVVSSLTESSVVNTFDLESSLFTESSSFTESSFMSFSSSTSSTMKSFSMLSSLQSKTTSIKFKTTLSTTTTTYVTSTSIETSRTTTVIRPTETPTLPPDSTTNVGDLTQVEIDNSVTLVLNGLMRNELILRHTQFTQAIANSINEALTIKRQTQSVNKEDVQIIEESIEELDDNLQLSLFVNGATAPIPQDVLVQAIENNEEEIAITVGADSVAVMRGLPEGFIEGTTERSGLSGGAIAVIIIVIVLVLVFVIVSVAFGGWLYYSKCHKVGKYYVTETAGGPEIKFTSKITALEDSTDINKLGMPMKETNNSLTVSAVLVNENTVKSKDVVKSEDTVKSEDPVTSENSVKSENAVESEDVETSKESEDPVTSENSVKSENAVESEDVETSKESENAVKSKGSEDAMKNVEGMSRAKNTQEVTTPKSRGSNDDDKDSQSSSSDSSSGSSSDSSSSDSDSDSSSSGSNSGNAQGEHDTSL